MVVEFGAMEEQILGLAGQLSGIVVLLMWLKYVIKDHESDVEYYRQRIHQLEERIERDERKAA